MQWRPIRRIFFFFQAEDGIRDLIVTGVQTCALPIFAPLSTYMSGDEIKARQRLIDESARRNGRSPESIRRIAQLVGVIDEKERLERSEKKPFFLHDKSPFTGSISEWADWLVSCYNGLEQDTFIFWPAAEGQEESQVRLFAEQVVPKVK